MKQLNSKITKVQILHRLNNIDLLTDENSKIFNLILLLKTTLEAQSKIQNNLTSTIVNSQTFKNIISKNKAVILENGPIISNMHEIANNRLQ